MRVLALYFPRLGVQLARAGRPDLVGRPLGLLSGEGDSALLAAVSVEATTDGVEPGMTALQARQRCPGITVLPDNAGACLDQLEALVSILRTRTTTNVAIVSRNAAAVSLEGLESRFAGEAAAAQGILALARSWTGQDVRAGVASTVEDAVCSASKARRFPAIVPSADPDVTAAPAGLPAYQPVSATSAWATPATSELALARVARMLGTLRPILDQYDQSFRTVRMEVARGAYRSVFVFRAQEPMHQPGEAVELIRARLEGKLEGVTELRVTLDGAGPAVSVQPWRGHVATMHELSAPAVPVQRRLLRAS